MNNTRNKFNILSNVSSNTIKPKATVKQKNKVAKIKAAILVTKHQVKSQPVEIDYRTGNVPLWVREIIATNLAIEAEDAKSAGSLGFIARALVIATMPYKDPKTDIFKRENGTFRLRIIAGYDGGIPFGIYPRLLMSWVTTEAVRTQSPLIELGHSLSTFLHNVLDLKRGGGKRGSTTRVVEQIKRLFGSLISAHYTGGDVQNRGFIMQNVIIADSLELYKKNQQCEFGTHDFSKKHSNTLWVPQQREIVGTWRSKVRLSESFFHECIDNPVPIDLRAYKALRRSPLAMDVYTWLTYRMSYLQRRSRIIRWEILISQFGSNYTTQRAVLDFKKAFLKALKTVKIVYPRANIKIIDEGIILLPSPPHITKQLKCTTFLYE